MWNQLIQIEGLDQEKGLNPKLSPAHVQMEENPKPNKIPSLCKFFFNQCMLLYIPEHDYRNKNNISKIATIALSKDGHNNISHPIYSFYNVILTLLSLRQGIFFPSPWISVRKWGYMTPDEAIEGNSATTWFLRTYAFGEVSPPVAIWLPWGHWSMQGTHTERPQDHMKKESYPISLLFFSSNLI